METRNVIKAKQVLLIVVTLGTVLYTMHFPTSTFKNNKLPVLLKLHWAYYQLRLLSHVK